MNTKKHHRFCYQCRRDLLREQFYPDIKKYCRDCCEKAWELMQVSVHGEEAPTPRRMPGYMETKILRNKRLELAGHCCEHCGETLGLSMHHVTYIRFENEWLEDVRILCRPCHYQADKVRRESFGDRRPKSSLYTRCAMCSSQ